MSVESTVRNLEELLDASSASPEFKSAVEQLSEGHLCGRIEANEGSPPVKVLRFVMKMLEQNPTTAFESVRIDAESTCSGFSGHAVAQPGDQRFEFDWDCAWRAKEEGWVDGFGDPDQIRAARTLGYQCFRRFEEV